MGDRNELHLGRRPQRSGKTKHHFFEKKGWLAEIYFPAWPLTLMGGPFTSRRLFLAAIFQFFSLRWGRVLKRIAIDGAKCHRVVK
jgi:hypothetical protein